MLSNLPPGVSQSDIPGDRPIDHAIDQLCSICRATHCPADESGDYADCPVDVVTLAQDMIDGDVDYLDVKEVSV
jgi:hypothetical protein